MAQKVTVQFFDDLDGSPLSGRTGSVAFSLEGAHYEIDLSVENRAKLRAALAPFIKAGRKVPGTEVAVSTAKPARRARRTSTSAGSGDAAKIRDWAKEMGHAVSERGRISAEVRAAYEAAH